MESKVSVIVPVYNVEKYLEKCVNSITSQDYSALEIILVDDGSTDQSGKICDRMAETDTRIKVIHKENGGLSDARNHGIEHATGDYLVFIDSDDYVHKSYVSILLKTVINTGSEIAVCNFREVAEDQQMVESNKVIESVNTLVYCGTEKNDRLYVDNLRTVVAWNKIYARNLFAQLRYPVGRLQEDEFIIHQLLHMAKKVAYIDAVLYYYLQRKSSIMSTVSLKNVQDGYDALQERQKFWLDTEQVQAYTQNLANQLFYATGYYRYVRKTYHNRALMDLLQKNIGEKIKDVHLKELLGRESLAVFHLFQKHPGLYYYVKDHEESRSLSYRLFRKLIRIKY